MVFRKLLDIPAGACSDGAMAAGEAWTDEMGLLARMPAVGRGYLARSVRRDAQQTAPNPPTGRRGGRAEGAQLPSRCILSDRLETLLAAADVPGVGVVLLDVEGLPRVDAAFGRSVGDQVRAEADRRLRELVPEKRNLAGFRDGEFGVLVEGSKLGPLLAAAELLRLALEAPYAVSDHEVRLRATAAAALDPAAGPRRLLERAEHALSRAKARGGGRVESAR